MSKIKCPHCGEENDKENNYCTECGDSLSKGFLSKLKNLFSSKNDNKIFKEYKQKKVRIEIFNDKYSISSAIDQYISSTTVIKIKYKEIYEKLDDFKKLNLNQKDYDSLNAFEYNYNNLDYIVKNLNKKFLKEYYSSNKDKIYEFLNLSDYIEDYKSILDDNKYIYKNISYCENPPKDIKKFIKRYDDFENISKQINEKYIHKHLDLDKINKFIRDYKTNIDYNHKIDKETVLLSYSSDYDVAIKVKNPNEEIREFIKCYENFNQLSTDINNEIDRRDNLKKDFSTNFSKISEFIDTYENPSDELYIKNYSHILNQFKNEYEISCQLIEFDDNKTAKKFINIYENFYQISTNINKEFIRKDFSTNFSKISEFIDTYDNPSDDLYIKNYLHILNQFKNEYGICSLLIEFDNNKTAKKFINIYENFYTISTNINREFNRRDKLKKDFSNNLNKICEFIDTYDNPSDDLYIRNYVHILNQFKNEYEISSQLIEFDNNKTAKKFIKIYEDFPKIVGSVNKNYIINLKMEFNQIKPEIEDFIDKFKTNISYDKHINDKEKQNILNSYKRHYNISSELISFDKLNENKDIINQFISLYTNLNTIINDINDEYNKRAQIKEDFNQQKSKIDYFIKKYSEKFSPNFYIENPKSELNKQKKNYELVLNYKKYYNDNLDIIDSFVNLYDNFYEISQDINEKFRENKYNQFLKSEEKIKKFIQKYTSDISYDVKITNTKKQEVLSDYKLEYELCKTLKEINNSNSTIDTFIDLYSNFNKLVSNINEEVKRRKSIIKYFNNKKEHINAFLDTYQNNVSDDLFIRDYNLVLNKNKKIYDTSKDLIKFSDNSIAEEFINLFENFKNVTYNINEKYCKKRYGHYIKNKEIIQNQFDKFNNLTINDYKRNKQSFINNFSDIYCQSKEIISYNEYLKLPNNELNFIRQFIDLYDYFDVNFINEYKKKYYEIELESLDFVECYRYNINCISYVFDYQSILKNYKQIYNLLTDIKKLEEIDFDVDDFIQVYENLDYIVNKTNNCYIKKMINEFNSIKSNVISFINHFQNLCGYIKDDKILQSNNDIYDKLKEIVKIPNFKQYFKENNHLIIDFIDNYENYDDIILKHNIKYVNNYFNENKIQIKEYFDVLDKNQDFYLADSKYKELTFNFNKILKIVKNLRDYQNDYVYLKDTKLIDNFPDKFDLDVNEIEKINKIFVNNELNKYKDYFDTILEHPLDDNQRRAVVIDEDNTQIVAGAGTGKTYTLQAKVKYLTEIKGVSPESILALSFSKLSVADLKDQFDKINVNPDTSTFHSLGLSILRDNGVKAKVLDYGLKTAIKKYFSEFLLNNPEKIDKILKYFAYYIYTPLNMDDIENIGELYDYENGYNLETFYSKYKKLKDPSLAKTTLKGEYVKSLEERMIANFLFLNGIKYTYEADYKPLIDWEEAEIFLFDFLNHDEIPEDITYDLVYEILDELEIDEDIYWPNGDIVDNYHPDFYLDDYGIYYEHFGVNRDCEAPWFNYKRRRTYIQEMINKRKLHKKYGTKLIETYSYYQSENRLLKRLEEKLKNENIEFKPIDAKTFLMALLTSEIKINEYFEFIKLIETFINLFKGNGYKKDKFNDFHIINKNVFKDFEFEKHELFLDIVEDIYDYYYKFLADNEAIDFNDMINDACEMIQNEGYSKNYSYIIVDEYQDTSHTRYNLLKQVKNYFNAKLIVVGDDWQSIYRFTGCDVDLFTNFNEYFADSKTEICEITNTYRNSQNIIDISGNFVMKNNHQYKKQLISKAPIQSGTIVLCEYLNKKDQPYLFENLISEIYNHSENKNKVKILVLGRNNADYKAVLHKDLFTTTGSTDNNTLKIIYHKNPKIHIKFLTVHGSKGLEENNVIVLNLEDKKAGFPNKMEDDSALLFVKNQKDEDIEFAEERRLFYVALTRTKNYTFLISPKVKHSAFIDELNQDNELVEFKFEKMNEEYDEDDDKIRIISSTNGTCPECGTGKMVLKFNPKTGKSFFNCSNWSRCDWFGGRYYGDIEEIENFVKYPDCGGILIKKPGRFGYFYGCINYYPDKLCRFTCNEDDVENPRFCPECGGLLKSGFSTFYNCTSPDCNFTCPVDGYDEFIQRKAQLKEKEINNLIKKSKKLEKSKKYEEAIEIYKKINTFESFKRLCICYRKLKLYAEELNLIYKSIHNNLLSDKEKEFFKKRIKEFNFENNPKNKIKIVKSNKKCDICGKPIVLKIIEKRDIKYITCLGEDCYWFGGVYEEEIEDFELFMG